MKLSWWLRIPLSLVIILIAVDLVTFSGSPSKILQAGEMSSQLLGLIEVADPNPDAYEFDLGGNHYSWYIRNASWGISPPNDPSRGIGTVVVYKNYDYTQELLFQPLGSLYAEEFERGPGVALAVGGMAVNTQLDKYYMDTAVSNNEGYWVPNMELGSGVLTPDSYTGRVRVKNGLPQGGRYGNPAVITLGSDGGGNYATITYNDFVNEADNGMYKIRLDSQGNFASDTFIKLPQFKVYVPVVTKSGI